MWDAIEKKVKRGERLSGEEGLFLYQQGDILALGELARLVAERRHRKVVYYIVNRHINPTNICVNRCRFCAFSRSEGESGAYELTLDEMIQQVVCAYKGGATEVHIVGGCHPWWRLSFYRELVRQIRRHCPEVCIQAFTAVEIAHLADMEGISEREVLAKLKDDGLDALPGGGAEVFSPRVRRLLCPRKISGGRWLRVMKTAHRLGLPSNATMLYGHIETAEEKVEHLMMLRQLQDETGSFMAFVPLSFHPQNTALSHLSAPTGIDDLREIAIARLMLDNFPHIKSFWVMLGEKLAQVSLDFGSDDLNGTVTEERITHMAGARTPQRLSVAKVVHLIREAGREPVERDTLYRPARRRGQPKLFFRF